MTRLRFAAALPLGLLITACQPTAPAEPVPSDPADLAFMGSWDCGVTVMTFLPEAYMPSNDADPIRVTEYKDIGNGATRITLQGGEQMVVQNVTDQGMNWLSMQTGDSFDCTRVAG